MVNRVRNSNIHTKSYSHWGLVQNNMQTKNVVRLSDGTLWTAVAVGNDEVFIYTSTDDGFSWTLMRDNVENVTSLREVAALNADGPFVFLVVNEDFDILDVYMADWTTSQYDIERRRYDLSDVTGSTPSNTTIELDMSEGAFDVVYNRKEAFIFFQDTGRTDISVIRADHSSTSLSSQVDSGYAAVYNVFTSICDDSSVCHLLIRQLTGGDNLLVYTTYDAVDGWNGSPVTIDTIASATHDHLDLGIAVDGYGNLCAVWGENGVTQTTHYAISTDSGATWSETQLTRTDGHGTYNDSATNDEVSRSQVIGGSAGGFVMSYVEDNASGIPKTYVRHISTSDGVTYTLGDEKEIATNSTQTTDHIVGGHFFLPNASRLMDISDPGKVRIAYTVGDGSSTTGDDLTSVNFAQELLSESAYQSTLTSDLTTYSLDTADSISILVSFVIHGSPNDNIDYYANGFTGDFTTAYINAFNTIGTSIRLKKYEPVASSELSDETAYGAATETNLEVLFDPQSYSFPTPQLTAAETVSYIEQDIRKIFLPPTQHLSRTFTVNAGGFLKRTVWLCEYDGNEYEISQVVPRFLDNQICYYEANAYVVGPSRNPFSRTVLPSET